MSMPEMTDIEIGRLSPSDVPELMDLWSAYVLAVSRDWGRCAELWSDRALVRPFIASHARTNCGVIARAGGRAVAFMAYDRFTFHGEDSAFFPVIGHARNAGAQATVYQMMYRSIADELVDHGCLNHFWTFFVDDQELQTISYELGFGLYVVDAFRTITDADARTVPSQECLVRRAGTQDVPTLVQLVAEFDIHYRSSPLFLARDKESAEEVHECVVTESGAVFVAEIDEEIGGFLQIQIADETHPVALSFAGMGIIEPLGAYVCRQHRGKGIGSSLVSAALRWCHERNVKDIHVDFESANIEANSFWRRHFRPSLYSTKRKISQDAVTIIQPRGKNGADR